ncbi:MAG TPA: 1,4-alpha-glucan branching protein domain-containing protein [Thermoleophilaceae bacterium]|nr:1,4-alpha-glucan branching protein domain-containing protein [Thermoleophilaceae bacterium]
MQVTGRRGALALVLHSHMPYVEGFGTWPFGEEWLWEALATVYPPLLDLLRDRPVTLGLTPVLCDQLELLNGEAGERFAAFLRDIRAPIHDMDAEGLERAGEPGLAAELRRAAGDYTHAEETFEATGRDVIGAFRELPGVELWTSAATHAVLPLLATDPGRRLQIGTGIASHERRFGHFGGGFWLPECAYEPGIERDLAEHGVRCFCVDQTKPLGLGSADQLEPVATAAGPVALPIDWQTVELIWGPNGYPASSAYRDYHGRTSHDLRPWSNSGAPYDRAAALALAKEHAAAFVEHVAARLDRYEDERGRAGLVCCALDTELIGHWWYEGPVFLEYVLAEAERRGVDLVTLPEGLERVEPVARELAASTWGVEKDLRTWDSPRVADFAFATRAAELRTLAAQASDWAFITTHELAADYPAERVRGHLAELNAALDSLDEPGGRDPKLRGLAPDLDLSAFSAP